MNKEFKHKILLVDGHALLYRAFYAILHLSHSSGIPTGAIFGFFSILFKAMAEIKPTHVVVTFDLSTKTYRDTLAGDYKAHRKPMPDDLSVQIPKVKEILEALDIPIYEKEGYEADDLLGIICHKTPKDMQNVILTGDLDLLQLINKNTVVYRLKTGISEVVVYDEKTMEEQFGLNPTQWVDFKALKGDASDNISGVPGIGEKTALKLIQEYGDLDTLYAMVEEERKDIKPAVLKKLAEGKDKAYLSKKLAHIEVTNGLDFDLDKCRLGEYDQEKVLNLLHDLEIRSLDKRLPGGLLATSEDEVKAPTPVKTISGAWIRTEAEALIAAYLLNPGRRNYDTSNWEKLENDLVETGLKKIFDEIEKPLIDVLERMKERGILLDLVGLKALSKRMETKINKLTKEIHKLAGIEFNISSPKQLQEILFEHLKISTENLKKNKKSGGISTAAESLEKMRGLHPIIDLIFEYREFTKLKSTYVDALPELVGSDGRIHTTYSQTIAATGRLSSNNPNLQNIPIRSELGNEVRKAFVAQKGFVLASLDYSQIELRIAAELAQDSEMIKIFQSGGDFHTGTASKIFNVPVEQVTPSQRRDAKTINFSVLYGVSAFGLSERSEMSRAEAGEYIKKYYQAFPKLRLYIDKMIKAVHEDGCVKNPLGRIRYFPEINSPNFAVRGAAERAAVNMPIQSLAADIIKMAMLKIEDRIQKSEDRCRMLLSVHDELVFEIKSGEENNFVPELRAIMEGVYKLSIPLSVDAKIGLNWHEMKKYA